MKLTFGLILKGFTVFFACIGLFLVAGYFAVSLGFTNTKGIIDEQSTSFIKKEKNTYERFPLAHTQEWISFKQSVAKDLPMIEKVSKETGVPPRILIAILVPEQMRLFYTDRPVFKKFFEPLKILGSQSQFSWGIFGIKDETAKATEEHLTNTSSPFYLGKKYEHALDFTTTDIENERFTRITDQHNHLYSYRYAALYVLQIESQWQRAGFPITNDPGIVATLWNLGFDKSKPNKDPRTGGSVLNLDDRPYSFGELARIFYYSDELIELYPIK